MPRHPHPPEHQVAGFPWWASLLGVTATVIGPPEGSAASPLVVLATMAGGLVYPLDDSATAPGRPAGSVGARPIRRHQASRLVRPGATTGGLPLVRRRRSARRPRQSL